VTALRDRFQKRLGPFARAVAVLAGGTAAAQVLSVAAAPVLTRLYTPTDFGLLGVFASILAIVSVVASARYEGALPLPRARSAATNLLVLSIGLAIAVGGVVGILGFTVGDTVLGWLNAGGLLPYLWLLPLGVVGAGVYQALSYWAIRKKAYGVIARTSVSRAGSQLVVQVGVGALGQGPFGLLLGQFLGQAGGSGSLLRLVWREDRRALARVTLRRIRAVARRYRRFPIFLMGASFLNRAGQQLPALLLVALYDPRVAGWFALGQKVVAVPLRFIGTSVAQVYLGEAAELAQGDVGRLRALFRRTVVRLMVLAVVPVVILAVAGPFLFGLVFGQSWEEAGVYARLLSFMFLVQFAVTPVSQTLNVLERQDLQLRWDATRGLLAAAALVVPALLGAGARVAIGAYAGAMALAYAELYWLSRRALTEATAGAGPGPSSGSALVAGVGGEEE
jgi:O-antigen/teichoic acid export membrane protein